MPELQIEFTNDTLISTVQGVERLETLLRRSVHPCLWAIKWCFQNRPNGISFHKSHKMAKKFAEQQIDSVPDGPARLVDVSDYIYECTQKHGYCWTNIGDFSEAKTYEGEKWNH
jgi:hypothetical protein